MPSICQNLMSFIMENRDNNDKPIFSNIVGSWLGNGENASISTDQITDLLSSDKISEFAQA